MSEQYYYLLSALPQLGELGEAPPIEASDFIALLQGSEKPLRVAQAVLLSDDLLQREAFVTGEVDSPETAVLTTEQARDEAPLPDFLQPTESIPRKIVADAIWEQYFRFAADIGNHHSCLLSDWVSFEVTLRNQIALTRAQSLGLEGQDYVVAGSLENEHDNFSTLVSEWSAAMGKSPLAAQRVLDTVRWEWLGQRDAYFSFTIDELVVYAARLMLTRRWHRLGEAEEKSKNVEV